MTGRRKGREEKEDTEREKQKKKEDGLTGKHLGVWARKLKTGDTGRTVET